MTDEQKRRGPAATQVEDTGQAVRQNVIRLRKARGLTTYTLAERLSEVGRPIPQSGISRIESGTRRVDADDLMALAIALNTSPISLLLPPRWGDAEIDVTGSRPLNARTAWRWIRGLGPASNWGADDGEVTAGHDADEYWDEGEREYIKQKEEYDAVTLPLELRRVRQHPAGRDADLVGLHVERAIRMADRAADEVFDHQVEQTKAAISRLTAEIDRLAEERALRKAQKGGA